MLIKQSIALGGGILGYMVLSRIDYRFWRQNGNFFYIGSILLLAGVLWLGQDIRGSQRWFDFGFFSFQPAELSKLALIIFLAKFFSLNQHLLAKFRYVAGSFLYVLLPVALVAREPDLGSAVLHVIIWLGMLTVSPMPRRYFLYLLVIFLLLGSLAWEFSLVPYQKDRILTFLHPADDPLGRGYNVIQSIVAVGSGGPWGRGLARGFQSQLRFLPERQTDFMFASTVEELGFLGGSLVILVFLMLLFRFSRVILKAYDYFGVYLAAGIFFLILTQSVVNIGMNLGLLPVTGIVLPFLSYGGSSILMTFLLLGILQNIIKNSAPVRFSP